MKNSTFIFLDKDKCVSCCISLNPVSKCVSHLSRTDWSLYKNCHLIPTGGYINSQNLICSYLLLFFLMRLMHLPVQNKPDPPFCLQNFLCIDLPFGGHLICPIHGVPCKFGKDIFNIKDAVLIFQKDPFLSREPIQSQSSVLLYYW